MKFYTTLLLSIIAMCATLNAQDAYHTNLLTELQNDYGLTGGSWVLTPNESQNASNATSYGNTTAQNTVTGQDFSLAVSMDVAAAGSNPWDAGYFIPNVNAVQQGDRVLMVIWLKTVSAALAAPGKINLFAENSTTYAKEVILNINPTTQWQQYFIPFEANDSYAAGTLNTGFHLAFQQQVIEYGGLALINYGTSVPLSSLPQKLNLDNYPGSDPNAPWRAAAASRIEQHRKADMQVQIQDAQGNPIPNATVKVAMQKHHYAFGTAVASRLLPGNPNSSSAFQSRLTNLDGQGHGFNWVVLENALKWRAWEQGWAGTKAETVNSIQWLLNQDIKIRGHVLVWPGWNNTPTDMQSNANDPVYLKNRIEGHLNAILNYPGVKDKIDEWDFINEIAHVRDIEYALQGKAGYPTGREIYPQIFTKAYQEDSTLVSYLNDYNILANGSVNGGDYTLFKSMVQEIIDAGSNVDGIGLQAHMGSALVDPDSLYAIIEDCYQAFGKPIKITEYDQSENLPDSLAAKYTGDFLTAVFSHPATNGFLMWGFWDGAHWLNNAPLYNQNWSVKPTHGVFTDLLFNQWWTDSTLTTDANGNFLIRGFKGDYEITATVNGADLTANVVLENDVNTVIQLFPVNTKPAIQTADFKVFPNPTSELLTVEMPYKDEWNTIITDAAGRVVYENNSNNYIQFINVSDYTSGIYYLTMKNSQDEVITKKVVVSH